MIEFMVIAAPRSGTTWAANWLCTDTTHCIHDPVNKWNYSELDSLTSQKTLGVACTGLFLFPDWLNAHPARKVILHRPFDEIVTDLDNIGLHSPTAEQVANLDRIDGYHCEWTELFTEPKPLYEWLLQRPFDAERHLELRQMHVQPFLPAVGVDLEVVRRMIEELTST